MPKQVTVVVKGVRGSRVINTNSRSAVTADEIDKIRKQVPCAESHGLRLVPKTTSSTMQCSGARCTGDPKSLRSKHVSY